MISYFKKKKINLIYLLFLIPIILFLYRNIIFDNDIWFLFNHGRYVLENGFPTIEPFTIHNNLSFIMQQWLSSVIFWVLYNYMGRLALYIFIISIGIIIIGIFYKLSIQISNNKFLSIICSIIFGMLLEGHIVSRPQIFTYLIILIELLMLEKYIVKNEKKFLIILPILSFFQINLHSSMWGMLYAFIIPYLINGIKLRKFNIKLSNYELKPIIITIIIMIIVGFINPYGYKAISYLFNSYGSIEMNNFIMEMTPLSFNNYNGKIFTILIFILIFIINFYNKRKLSIRLYLLLIGTALLTFMHNKGWPYFMIVYFLSLTYLLKDIDIKRIILRIKNKYVIAISKGIYLAISVIVIFIFLYSTNIWIQRVYKSKEDNIIKETVDFMEENYNLDSIILYIDYNNGGYTEYRGIKSYIDPRAEVFFKNNNKKEDIFLEFYNIGRQNDFDFNKFINKYNFTHILVYCNDDFDKFLIDNDDYKLVYTQKYDKEYIMNLYTKK